MRRTLRILALILGGLIPAAAGAADVTARWTFVAPGIAALKLTHVEENAGWTTFSLQNVSTKRIEGYAFSLVGTTHYEGALDPAGPGAIPPGGVESYTTYFTEPPKGSDRIVHVVAVLFDDGSGQGSEDSVDAIRAFGVGVALEGTRIANILAAQPPQTLSIVGIDALAHELGPVPKTRDEAFYSLRDVGFPELDTASLIQSWMGHAEQADAFFMGARHALQQATGEVKHLRELPESSPDARAATRGTFLAALKEKYAAKIQTYRAFYARRGGKPQ